MFRRTFFLCCLFAIATAAHAKVQGTAWVGASELLLDGTLYCSSDQTKKPIYRPVVGGPLPSFTIHEGGLGWIWPQASGGCAHGWLNGYFELQSTGTDVVDKNGKVIGKITDSEIQAKDYSGAHSDVTILSFKFTMISEEAATVAVQFRHKAKDGIFNYTANLVRYRDANWK